MEYYSAIKEDQTADDNVGESEKTVVRWRNQTQRLYSESVNVLDATELYS